MTMQNALTKHTWSYIRPGSPGVPATPGRPASPARTVVETRRVCSFERISSEDSAGQEAQAASLGLGGNVVGIPVPSASADYRVVCRNVQQMVFYPALDAIAPTPGIPAVDPQTIVDYSLGWDGAARSIDVLMGDGSVKFTANTNLVGGMVGFLNAGLVSTNGIVPDYSVLSHAFYIQGRTYAVYESGQRKTDDVAFTDGKVFTIRRRQGQVTYLVDGAAVYSSTAPSTPPVFLEANLYSGGDTVFDPAIVPSVEVISELPPLSVSGGQGTGSRSITQLRAFTSRGAGHTVTAAAGVLPAFVSMGSDGVHGESAAAFAPFTTSAYANKVTPSFGLARTSTAYLVSSGAGFTGGIGQSAASLVPPVAQASNKVYGASAGVMPALRSAGNAYDGPYAGSVLSVAGAGMTTLADALVAVVINISVTGDASLAAVTVKDDALIAGATPVDTYSLTSLLDAAVTQLVAVQGEPPVWDNAGETVVVNYATSATSVYTGLEFNSYFTFGDRRYGVARDGLYELTGDTDDGAPIEATVDLGQTDSGTTLAKLASECYIAAGSAGELYLRVTANGAKYLYRARTSSADMQLHRVDLGKGLRANFFKLELLNTDGDDFTFDRLEFRAAATNRRF